MLYMSSRFTYTSSLTKVVLIFEFFILAYLVYSLTKNLYNGYKIDKYIANARYENEELKVQNAQKTEDYFYYTSPEYIDKIAKQTLGLVNPGEEVVVLAPDVVDDGTTLDSTFSDDGDDFAIYANSSNPRLWFKYFFD